MTLPRVPESCLSGHDGMDRSFCTTHLALAVDNAEQLRNGCGVSAQDGPWFKPNTSDLAGSRENGHAPEGGSTASVALDGLVGT